MSEPRVLDPSLERHWTQLNRQPGFRRTHPATLRAAWWAWRSLRQARRDLAQDAFAARVPAPPPVPWGARTGVLGVLARTSPTCLERCVVHQRWLAAHDLPTTVLIGVRRESGAVKAHAWIDELAHPDEFDGYRVIHRLPAP